MSHRGLAVALVVCCLVGGSSATNAHAQSQLVPLVTDQTPLPVANTFGTAGAAAVNQHGDYAFVGNGSSALFLRRAGGPIVRVIQMGDEVPGFPGSRLDLVGSVALNSSGLLATRLDFGLQSGVMQGAIFVFDGVSLTKVVSGLDVVPGTSGVHFERAVALVGLNDHGDVAFSAPLVPMASVSTANTTLFIAPAGAPPVRVAGLGDAAPGTAGTYTSLVGQSFNNRGEVLFRANVAGLGSGLFVGTMSDVQKVVATGDTLPSGSGAFLPGGNPPSFLNNDGVVAFQSNGAIWTRPAGGVVSRAIGVGDPSPTGAGSTLSPPTLRALADGGVIAFSAQFSGTPTNGTGLFRLRTDSGTETVATAGEAAPGTTGQTFTAFNGVSANATGTVSFFAPLSFGAAACGLFQQTGTDMPIALALDGGPAPSATGGWYALSPSAAAGTTTRTLGSGDVWFWSYIAGGAAAYGEFLVNAGSTQVLMDTAEPLPSGARVVLRTFRVTGVGDQVGFLAQRPGGAMSTFRHDIGTGITSLVMTEGDSAPGGGRVVGGSRNTVFTNASGTIAFLATVVGGPGNVGAAIFLQSGTTLTRIVGAGDTDPVTGRKFATIGLSGSVPSPLNDAGQVVFSATETGAAGETVSGLFVGSTSGITKVAMTGDLLSDGTKFISFSTVPASSATIAAVSINQAGQVSFPAMTGTSPADQRPGLYCFTPGPSGGIVRVARNGDAAPGGGRFGQFSYPAIDGAGHVAFVASLTGSTSPSGVFTGSSLATLVPVALDGQAAPGAGGALFTIASLVPNGTPLPDLAMNNGGDLLFRANLTGGAADSGWFIRRVSSGTVEKVVLQGEPAPGTDSVFATISVSLNTFIGENVVFGAAGDIALQTPYVSASGKTSGVWHIKADGTIEPMLVRGVVASEFGGGVAVTSSPGSSWNSGGRFPLWARISGGTFTDGVFLFVPTTGTSTPAGTGITVQPIDNTTGEPSATLTFNEVTTPGTTTLTTSAGGPIVPSSFALGDPPLFYNLSTTAVFSGSITVCIDFSAVRFPDTTGLRLLHYEAGAWVDVTTGGGAVGNTICGSVTSLSPFVVVRDAAPPALSVSVSPSVLWAPNNKLVTITATVVAADSVDPSPAVQLVSITSNEPLAPGDIQGAVFGADCRSFQLRATRQGSGNGRIYVITYRATDAAGNAVSKSVQVVVPHDSGRN